MLATETRKHTTSYFILLLFFCELTFAQNWSFKFKSKVELKSWELTSQAKKNATFLNGASVKLYKASALVSESVSDASGNFEMSIPPDGDYTLIIEYTGCNPKKFAVSTKSMPPDKNAANFKPSVDIVGIIMSKHVKDAKYIGLDQSHIKIEYAEEKKEEGKRSYSFRQNIYDAEYLVIQKFCTANKLGDMALDRKNYPVVKSYYQMAMNIMDGEPYPKTQLEKAEEGLKTEKASKTEKNSKTKQSDSNQKIIAKSQSPVPQKTVGTGKARHKTLQKLGK